MMSVVIPAHDEETTIGRCMEGLLADAQPGEFEVIVVCNGCSDRTAAIARSFGPMVTVIELGVASKYLALRAGDERASGFPRFYVDADVVAPTQALRDVAAVLDRGEALVAAPRLRMDLEGRPRYVRAYYRLWAEIPYSQREMVGSGFYALSEAGRRRFGEFPDVIADDQFVLSCFHESERRVVDSAEFIVAAPRNLRGLVHKKTRTYTGNRQLSERVGTKAVQQPGGRAASVGALRRRPTLVASMPAYLFVCSIAEVRSRQQVRRRDFGTWERDASTRVIEDRKVVQGHPDRHGVAAFARNVADPRSWLHLLRIVHYYSYAHVRERARIQFGSDAKVAPNVSLRNGERIAVGARSNIGERCSLWAGDRIGRITIGDDVLLAPQVFITASNYQFTADVPIMSQPCAEADVVIGDDVWLGAGVVVVAGVTIGDGCVVGAGSVVTRSLPAGAIAAGCPARAIGSRGMSAAPLAKPVEPS
jgi:acetyltransferase-like isoleucine patch superfamily enzyme